MRKKNNPDFEARLDAIMAKDCYQSAHVEKQNFAKALLKYDRDVSLIAEMTKLSIEEVEQLKLEIEQEKT